jgi:hypothetical protein
MGKLRPGEVVIHLTIATEGQKAVRCVWGGPLDTPAQDFVALIPDALCGVSGYKRKRFDRMTLGDLWNNAPEPKT